MHECCAVKCPAVLDSTRLGSTSNLEGNHENGWTRGKPTPEGPESPGKTHNSEESQAGIESNHISVWFFSLSLSPFSCLLDAPSSRQGLKLEPLSPYIPQLQHRKAPVIHPWVPILSLTQFQVGGVSHQPSLSSTPRNPPKLLPTAKSNLT